MCPLAIFLCTFLTDSYLKKKLIFSKLHRIQINIKTIKTICFKTIFSIKFILKITLKIIILLTTLKKITTTIVVEQLKSNKTNENQFNFQLCNEIYCPLN
jgi:hypothetical protein